ncbi:hypothetical protein GCM10010168_42280 [Actinoplanes ianthinogenes]|uniref:Ig-like domain-containing protein n=1 Tax=Actinoplanes ianthinogenes TaxID=122358 RepID=A0ABM7LVV9_9ACTN|nr:Ig-like domain-containing protein [Actinoplanes ianthinogenes]BCJ43462.1 hypothetical protein Aiant_41190 [Actinoplanes ianthinogenes]GGR19939.1 hypothetical protein GCM10010168_42280 [Actinoplanes ianthinogenes]
MIALRAAASAVIAAALLFAAPGPAAAGDTTPPVVSQTGLTEGQLIGPHTLFRPVVSDDVEVMRLDILVNGIYRNSFGRYQGEFVAAAYLADIPDDTDVDVTVRVEDRAHNTGARTTRVHVDKTAPTAILSLADNAYVGGVTTLTPDQVSADTARIVVTSLDGQEISQATAAPWNLRWDTTTPGQTGAVRVTVEDHAGNTTVYNRLFQIDNTAPTASITSSQRPHIVGRGKQILIGSVTDPAGVDRIEWWVDGALRGTGSHLEYDFGDVQRSTTVELRAWDRAGNQTVTTYPVTVDATPPRLVSISPEPNALVRGSGVLSTVRFDDQSDIAWVLAQGQQQAMAGSDAPYTVPFSLGSDGIQRLGWQVADTSGNWTTVYQTVIVDNTRPKLTVTRAPKNRAKVKGTVKVHASATDRNGISRVELLINGRVVARDRTASYSFAVDTKKYGKTIHVRLRAYDRAGNVTDTVTRTWRR